ncbi:MAG: alginate export family protein, partial [Candidatus Hydrogenedentes bacterium]|nr:alginate export family protein [Candidatus Hydrogenedentota bacterium]
MKHLRLLGLGVAAALVLLPCGYAELQNVQVGGELQIRAIYWHNAFNQTVAPALVEPEVRWPGFFLPRRPIGDVIGGQSVTSFWDWDSRDSDFEVIEQRTRLNVNAEFTNEVRAFIELESYDVWGEDFRSNYVSGADGRAVSTDDVEVYQAYIEANDMFGMPVRMRIGRQELVLGSGWLVGNNQSHPEFPGLSFDAARFTYATDQFSVDSFYALLAEGGIAEQDGDIELVGLYGSYTGLENISIDAYWLWLRDARSLNDTNFVAPIEWLEDVFSIDDYDVTSLHTVGLRAAGTIGALDFEAEAAYQFGDAGQVGFLFKPFTYGDDDAEFDAWAGTLELGYTLDIAWTPRLYFGGAYFQGEDNRDLTFIEWANPFYRPEASVSFNRL